MGVCSGITQGAVFPCDPDELLIPGVLPNSLIVGNLDDVDSIVFDTTTKSLIKDIKLATGKQAYKFEGFRQSLVPSTEFVPGNVSVGWDHTIQFQIFDLSQAQKENIRNLGLVRTFAVIETRMQSEARFEVYGIGVGLLMSEGMKANNDADTQGSFTITLSTPDDGAREPYPPSNWWDTDLATTRPLVESLLVPEPAP